MSARALASVLWLALLAPWRLWPRADAGCSEEGRCCPGRDPACASTGWRMDRVYGTCFCDEACKVTGDCCYDYSQACPAVPCIVGEWSHWSGCAEQCKPNMRMRRRYVKQEPKNGGEPCPPLEEKSGCLEYLTYQRQDCGHEYGPLPGCPVGRGTCPASVYNPEGLLECGCLLQNHTHCDSGLAVAVTCKGSGVYCVEFKTESLSHHCTVENRPYARWMQYLREGYTVCVACQPPAMNTGNRRCSGDGLGANENKILHWQAVGNPRCQGTWKKVQQMEQCSCPVVHSFIFT